MKIISLLYLLPLLLIAKTSENLKDNLVDKNKTILTVAIEEGGYSPYYYQANGKIEGFSVDVLDYVEANSQYDFEFIILPWPRALHLVSIGKVDIILTLFKNSKRESIYNFIEPSYGYEVNQLFSLVENKFEYTGQLEQLTPYTIGSLREYSYGEDFDRATYLNKLPVLTEEVLLKVLLGKRTDVVISNRLVFQELISKNNASAVVKAIEPYIAVTPVHMALTKERDNAETIQQTIGQLMKQLKSSPYYQELLDKYQLNVE